MEKREIKFRAWFPSESRITPEKTVFELCANANYFSRDLQPELILLQYIGVKDRNGVEIYEGDIIKWGDLKDSEETVVRIAEVKINPDIQFDCKNIPVPHVFHYGNFIYGGDQVEVIGNIYTHPHLLPNPYQP